MQRAAANEIAIGIARNPGPLQTICVAYAGAWEDPPLPTLAAASLSLTYSDGCEEIDGQLFALAGGARAISMGVGEPEVTGASRAEVSVFTSTGLDDFASYRCTLGRRESAWVVEECDLGAVG